MKVSPSLSRQLFRAFIVLSAVFTGASHMFRPIPALAQTSTTINLTGITVTPANPTVGLGSRNVLSAAANFSDTSIQNLGGGHWDVLFSPQMDVSLCPPLPEGAPVFAQQAVNASASGIFHDTWEANVTVDGKTTTSAFSLTMTCSQSGATLGSITASWTGTEFDGTFSAAKNSGSIIVRGTTWTSSNPAVATVDTTGAVTGVSAGVTTVTATYGAVCWRLGGQPPTPIWGCEGSKSGSTAVTVGRADDNNDFGPIKTGYAVITSISGAPAGGVLAFATFGLKRGNGDTAQAGVLPAAMTSNAFVVVETNPQLGRDFGLAVANPGAIAANLMLTLRKDDGTLIATKPATLGAGNQTALFVSQIFSDQASALASFAGTLSITSDNPVAIVGLKFRGAEFSTVLITSLSGAVSVPRLASGVGGPGALILPQFAEDGGWSTQFVIANPGTTTLTARLDVFDSKGKPLQIALNGTTQSSFTVTVNANGMATLAPLNASGQTRF